MRKIAIIGGGASGLMAGGLLVNNGEDVTIFDGNEKCGKKIYITGKGRCNLTNNCSKEEFLNNVVHGNKFMMSSINGFSCQDTIEFFESLGMKTKVERGNRVFPLSDKASDVTKYLLKNAQNCKIQLNEKVLLIKRQENDTFQIKTEKGNYFFDKVIIATGGKSYPATGSQGDGYKFASELGVKVNTIKGALVPIKIKDKFCKDIQGLSLKNVKLIAEIDAKKKEMFGEMLFTNDAISGPIALSMSSFINDGRKIKLAIDFKPALDEKQLDERFLKDFKNNLNKNISFIIKGLLPNRLVDIFLDRCKISKDKKVNSITVQERHKMTKELKNFTLIFDSLYPVETGIITSGGVDLQEINPKTMECKKIKNLYFIGEVLDIDCLTGGFNLQTAFSTAYACASNLN